MLFVLNSAGVPSVAAFVRLAAGVANQPPTATITSPASNVTVDPGGSVFFAGAGNDPDGSINAYSWSFPGGVPPFELAGNGRERGLCDSGTSVASLTVTDNAGAQSSPATRTVTVSNFALSATPASRSVSPGGSTTYAAPSR